MNSYRTLAFLLIVSLGTGYAGSLATSDSVGEWYPTIAKPAWTPPDAVFGPVWSTLFVMMGIAAWRVWLKAGSIRQSRAAFVAFGIQLALNLSWSVLFFGMRLPGAAFAEIVALWCAIAATIVLFDRHSRAAAALLVPYLAWVSFAACLNFAIWRLNG